MPYGVTQEYKGGDCAPCDGHGPFFFFRVCVCQNPNVVPAAAREYSGKSCVGWLLEEGLENHFSHFLAPRVSVAEALTMALVSHDDLA